MSLLRSHEPVKGWTPAAAAPTPESDAMPLLNLVQAGAILLRKGGVLKELGRNVGDAYHYFAARLLEGRHEAAEIRYALHLPMEATTAEVVAAIKARP
jgi:hypothetical protein